MRIDPTPSRQALAFLIAVPAAWGVGRLAFRLLAGVFARGAAGRFVARWWAWGLGAFVGLSLAVAVAGPRVLGRGRGAPPGSASTRLTVGTAAAMAAFMGLMFAVVSYREERREGRRAAADAERDGAA